MPYSQHGDRLRAGAAVLAIALVLGTVPIDVATAAQQGHGTSTILNRPPNGLERIGQGRPTVSEPQIDYSPSATLRNARTLYVDSCTAYLTDAILEEKLANRPEFARLGLRLTRHVEHADIVVEVERSIFTTRFNYSLIDPRTRMVLSSGRVNSLFGTASGKIANRVVGTLAKTRTTP